MKQRKGRDNDNENINQEAKKLDLKKEEHEKKIQDRLKEIDKITDKYPELKEMREINSKFHDSYNKRVDFGQAMIRARENCGELKKKVERFLKQQNMLMIKLKGGGTRKR